MKKNKLTTTNPYVVSSVGGNNNVWPGIGLSPAQSIAITGQLNTVLKENKPKDFKNCYRVDITFSTYFSDEEDSLNSSIALKENIKKEFGQLGTIKSIKITEELNFLSDTLS